MLQPALITIIIAISGSLAAESSKFFESISGPGIRCYIYPAILIVCSWLLTVRIVNQGKNWTCIIMLTGIIGITVSGAISYSIDPMINDRAISATVKMKLSAYDQRISDLKDACSRAENNANRVTRQKWNVADQTQKASVIVGQLASAIKEKAEYISSIKPDMPQQLFVYKKIIWTILLRLLLEALNLFCVGWLSTLRDNRDKIQLHELLTEMAFRISSRPDTVSKNLSLERRWKKKLRTIRDANGVQEISTGVQETSTAPVNGVQEISTEFNNDSKEEIILEYLRSQNGSVPRQKLMGSRRLSSGEYDAVLDSLLQKRKITVSRTGNKTAWVYSLLTGQRKLRVV